MLGVQAVVSGCICSSRYTNMSSKYTPLLQLDPVLALNGFVT